jgi:hypothetical protein
MLAGILLASTRVYEIEPFQNCNGWTPGRPNNVIGQIFVATCDSFLWVDFFVGAPNHAQLNNKYNVQIFEYPNGVMPIAQGEAPAGESIQYRYTHANLTQSGRVLKGKEYLLKITHGNGDSINYYYDSLDTYKYGNIVVGGIAEPGPKDLAARIEV